MVVTLAKYAKAAVTGGRPDVGDDPRLVDANSVLCLAHGDHDGDVGEEAAVHCDAERTSLRPPGGPAGPLLRALEDAVAGAKTYLTDALLSADRLTVGHGHGPVHHFSALWRD